MKNIEIIGREFLTPSAEKEKKEDRRKGMPHLYKPGQSGNPVGRPKGAKNKTTLLKEAVLAKAEENLLENWEEVVKTTITLAKGGDSTCLKILWDRIMPSREERQDKDKLNITINVNGMDIESVGGERVIEEPIEGEFTEDG